MRVSDARAALHTHEQLLTDGRPNRAIRHAVATGALHRLSRGLYVDGTRWSLAKTEEQELFLAVAAHHRLQGETAVFVSTSAAALHELPLVRVAPRRAHVAGPKANGQVRACSPFVARHELTIARVDVIEIDGIRVTSLARTVADLLRTAPAETAISVADAALRREAWDNDAHTYDEARAAAFRAHVSRRLHTGARGVVQARRLLDMADGRADGPGESISRLYLLTLGVNRLRLQVPVAGPRGRDFYVDFGLDDAGVWGEFDGKAKYTDPALRRPGETAEDVLLRQQERENWIVGATERRFVRWGWEHIASIDTLARRLSEFRVLPAHVPSPAEPSRSRRTLTLQTSQA